MSIIKELKRPLEWGSVPLGRLAHRIQLRDCPDLDPLSVFLDDGVVPRSSREDNYNRLGEDLRKYQLVRPGDIVFNKLRTWQGGFGVSDYTGIVSPAYFVCRPLEGINPRFLHYLLRSAPYLQELTRVSKWMPPSQFDISWDQLRRLPILLPPISRQRDIAEYLDAETTRIDRLVSKKAQVQELLSERTKSLYDKWFADLSSAYGLVSIRRLCSGIEQGWSPACDAEPASQDEWGVIRTSAVSFGRFIAENNKRLPSEIVCEERWRLCDGDLLVVRGSGSRSSVGRACVARVGKRLLTLSDLVYRVRLAHGDPGFVAASLLCSPARAQIEASIRTDVGQTLKIRRDDLADVRIPAAPYGSHVLQIARLTKELLPIDRARMKIEKQIELLTERRQAVLTGAVTGQLEIPGLAG